MFMITYLVIKIICLIYLFPYTFIFLFQGPAYCLTQLISIQQQLRKIPVIELYTPTAVLVGSPNVGKSSIVRYGMV